MTAWKPQGGNLDISGRLFRSSYQVTLIYIAVKEYEHEESKN